MTRYSVEPRTSKWIKGYGFLSFARTLCNKYRKKIIGYCYRNRTRCYKSVSKKVFYKTSEATEELIGNRIAEKSVRPKPVPEINLRSFKDIFIPPEKRI